MQDISGLKIYSHLPMIIDSLRNNSSVILSAPTGTGKTVGLSVAIHYVKSSIMIMLPSIVSVEAQIESLSRTIPKESLGWAFDEKVEYTNKSSVVLATSGHVKKKFLKMIKFGRCGDVNFPEVLMVDEAHLGTLDITLIINLWNYCFLSGSRVPRLLLVSATIDPNIYPPAFPIEINVPNKFPIERIFHGKDYIPGDPQLIKDLVEVVKKYHNSEIKGDFLIFAPGAGEINEIVSLLLNLKNAETLPYYSESGEDVRVKVLGGAIPGKRKIVVATNVAEASVTIENLSFVLDMLQNKVLEVTAAGGSVLMLRNIAKSSAEQRAGRVGRIGPGTCYRMCSEKFYSKLNDHIIPEITRIPLERLLLEIYSVGIDPRVLMTPYKDVRNFKLAIENIFRMNLAENPKITKVKEIVGKDFVTSDVGRDLPLDSSDKEEKRLREGFLVTKKGQFIFNTSLDTRNGSFLWYWYNYAISPGVDDKGKLNGTDFWIYPGIVVASMLTSYKGDYTRDPPGTPGKSFAERQAMNMENRLKFHKMFFSENDIEAMLKMWNSAWDCGAIFSFYEGDDSKLNIWASKNMMNFKRFRSAVSASFRIMNSLKSVYSFDTNMGRIDPQKYIRTIRVFIGAAYFDNICIQKNSDPLLPKTLHEKNEKKSAVYILPKLNVVISLNQSSTFGKLPSINPKYIIPIITNERENKNKNKITSTITLDIDENLIRSLYHNKKSLPVFPGEKTVVDFLPKNE